MPFPQVTHNHVNVLSPVAAQTPPPDTRLLIGRAQANDAVPFEAPWIFRVDMVDVSRYWLLLTTQKPFVFRLQFIGRPGQMATVRTGLGELLRRLPAWDGARDELGVPANRQAFLNHAPSVDVEGAALVTIVTATRAHEFRIVWSEAATGAARGALPPTDTWSPGELTKADIVALTGWTMNQIDFFIVDIAAGHACYPWPNAEEFDRVHELVAQRPPLKDRGPIGRRRGQNTRAEMIRRLNTKLSGRGEPEIKGAGVRALQHWASEALNGTEAVRGLEPALYTATVDVAHSGEYRRGLGEATA